VCTSQFFCINLHPIVVFVSFVPQQLFFLLFYFSYFLQTLFDHTKFIQLNLIHGFVYIGMFSSSVNFLHHVLCLFIFVTVLILFQLSFFKSSQKVVNGVGFAR